ncbi:hypothetical protein OS125_11465 [Corynebacterium sp. P7003]|uniref:Uncharacterized protein n=1 Tax=Corynebacterium pygosceleis TaxID=2800406 RepID=A0ABT3WXW3_9CORY|nr:hypothetical protein [Corynebacterium pygosceleis]MCX7445849.1 hypothetical protein [Corynebacterium pygosceleis]
MTKNADMQRLCALALVADLEERADMIVAETENLTRRVSIVQQSGGLKCAPAVLDRLYRAHDYMQRAACLLSDEETGGDGE